MKERVQTKIVAIKKGVPKWQVERLLQAISKAWEQTHPGEKLYCIPVEVEDDLKGESGQIIPPFRK